MEKEQSSSNPVTRAKLQLSPSRLAGIAFASGNLIHRFHEVNKGRREGRGASGVCVPLAKNGGWRSSEEETGNFGWKR